MAAAVPKPGHRWQAAIYDKILEPGDRKRMAPLRAFAAGGARGRVIEVGAGTGANLPHYNWPEVESLTVTEPDPFMLKRLRSKLVDLPVDVRTKIEAQEVPAERLPFPDASFDVAISTLVLCTVANPTTAIAELRRIIKAGGELRLVEHVKAEGRWGDVQRLIQPVYGWFSGDCQLSRNTEDALSEAGFQLENTRRFNLGAPLWPAFTAVARLPA